MINRSGHPRGSACQERQTSAGNSVKAPVCPRPKHEPISRLTSITAAVVAVQSLPQQQASHSSPDPAAPPRTASAAAQQPQQGSETSAAPIGQQQIQQLQISSAQPLQQQDWLQLHDGDNSSDSSNDRPYVALLGSRPGVIWHTRRRSSSSSSSSNAHTDGLTDAVNGRSTSSSSSSSSKGQLDWNVQYAAAAILDAFGSMDLLPSSSASNSSSRSASAQATAEEADLQQHDQHKHEQLQQPQASEAVASYSIKFDIMDRQQSHVSVSTRGRAGTSSSSWWLDIPVSSHSSSSNIQRETSYSQGQSLRYESSEASAAVRSAAAAAADADLASLLQGPAANFRDPRFEMAISRWVKEAPDWFKVRTVFERFSWRFNIVNLSCTLQKLTTLLQPLTVKRPLRAEQKALRQFLREVLKAVGEMMPSVDAGTGVALLLSYSRLLQTRQVRTNPQLVDSLLEHMRPQLGSLQPQQLAGCVWALKGLQHTPSDDWMDELYAQSEGLISRLRPDEIAVVLRGLAGIQAGPPKASWLATVLAHAEGQLEQMEPKHMAIMLMGLAYMQVTPSRSWTDTVMAACRSRFNQMGPQALSNVLWALAKMGCLPDRPWLNSYFNTTLRLLNSMNATELSVDMWSVNKLMLEPNDEWLDEYFDESEAKLSKFTLQHLALCGYSLAKLGLRPPQTWLRRYCTLLLRLKGGLWKNKKLLTQVLVALDSFKVPRMDMWRRELYSAAGYKLWKYPNWRQRVKVAPTPTGPYSMWPYGSSRRRFGRRGLGLSRTGSGARAVGTNTGLSPRTDTPLALRSGDWGVMDSMGGGIGVRGSGMSSYEELGSVKSPMLSSVDPVKSEGVRAGDASASAGTAGSIGSNSVSSGWGSATSREDRGTISGDSCVQSGGLVATGAARQGVSAGSSATAGVAVGSVASSGEKAPSRMLTSKGWVGGRGPARRPLSSAGLVRPPPPPTATAAAAESGPASSSAAAAAAAGAGPATPVAAPIMPTAGDPSDGLAQVGSNGVHQCVEGSTTNCNGRLTGMSADVEEAD